MPKILFIHFNNLNKLAYQFTDADVSVADLLLLQQH